MAKSAIVELQRPQALREGANLRVANKLPEIAGHSRVLLPKLATKLADYLSAIYDAAMGIRRGTTRARHDTIE